jgi:hypothetical protein
MNEFTKDHAQLQLQPNWDDFWKYLHLKTTDEVRNHYCEWFTGPALRYKLCREACRKADGNLQFRLIQVTAISSVSYERRVRA